MAYYMVLPYCVAIIKNAEGKILVGKHSMSQRKPYPGYWDFPGGKLEDGETPEECIKREVLEELGVQVTELKLLGVYHHDKVRRYPQCTSDIPGLAVCYECSVVGNLAPTEQKEVHFADASELKVLQLTPWCVYFLSLLA